MTRTPKGRNLQPQRVAQHGERALAGVQQAAKRDRDVDPD